ncbi:V4R domain-containing protein [Desulfomonile tiedjei]|uniref:Putative hydrocarbon binding protein (Contains V4R domain) n=1 Tax=Desulfomonile tiedjei (strain ATCC 49306 / DSM 6799 / DCB-1) TaxID=706587 RepID=I4C9G3_DESTA|nr:V4R domain-containing protein [Desulfomonile tiedjei]AFM26204.1 putative hydrocarbon binding protein (contains V4R domain) [Desulfomonile tiedjei DSM 6799]
MFKEDRTTSHFRWEDLGNIDQGRPNLGPTTLVAVYRLMQYTMRDVLIVEYDPQAASQILVKAGKLAGSEFCKSVLNVKLEFNEFIADLQEKLKLLRIGILRIEKADLEKMEFVLTVDEDLDCSGLPLKGETVCDYDEGFIAGVLDTYTGKEFEVREIDCWASGERTCRFSVNLKS